MESLSHEAKKQEIAQITSKSLGLEWGAFRRQFKVILIGVAVAFFLAILFHIASGKIPTNKHAITMAGYGVLGLALTVALTVYYRFHYNTYHYRNLIQFQETRLDSLKAALASNEKRIEELKRKIQEMTENRSEPDRASESAPNPSTSDRGSERDSYVHQTGLP